MRLTRSPIWPTVFPCTNCASSTASGVVNLSGPSDNVFVGAGVMEAGGGFVPAVLGCGVGPLVAAARPKLDMFAGVNATGVVMAGPVGVRPATATAASPGLGICWAGRPYPDCIRDDAPPGGRKDGLATGCASVASGGGMTAHVSSGGILPPEGHPCG